MPKTIVEINLKQDKSKLEKVAEKLGVSFSTVAKVVKGTSKNWRNCVVRGENLREQIEEELTHDENEHTIES